jgi:hypothetical protein
MLLANVFLRVWDYDRLKHVLPFARVDADCRVPATTSRLTAWFFGFVVAAIVSVIVINQFLYDIRPGNSQEECTNGCKDNGSPDACQNFCGCIYEAGHPLNVCLDEYRRAKRSTPVSPEGPQESARIGDVQRTALPLCMDASATDGLCR